MSLLLNVPATRTGKRGRPSHVPGVVKALNAARGKWVPVYSFPSEDTAQVKASQIRNGKVVGFDPNKVQANVVGNTVELRAVRTNTTIVKDANGAWKVVRPLGVRNRTLSVHESREAARKARASV